MLRRLSLYASLVRFGHSVFALPFALVGALLAARQTPLTPARVGWSIVAMVAARTAAMAFNRLVDARFDALNPRTADRELPRGALSSRDAIVLVVVASVGSGHRARTEVARALGARPLQRWARVFLPTARPAAGAAGLVVLVYSIGTYEVAWLLGRAYPEPLPVLAFRLFGSIDLDDRPAAAAAAATGSALALGLALCVLILLPRGLASLSEAAGGHVEAAER